MKYIIINCPASYRGYRSDYECDSKGELCEEGTDCLLKQIVEKCKEECTPTNDEWTRERENIANEILSMLEIQECE